MAEDTVAYWFFGFVAGVSLGLTVGWFLARLSVAKPSTVVIEKTDSGYLIHEG